MSVSLIVSLINKEIPLITEPAINNSLLSGINPIQNKKKPIIINEVKNISLSDSKLSNLICVIDERI
ncbi:MAG: hypothetical protein ABRQ38_12605 [Candidatus Eremiobacterota bacterium]